MKVLSDLYKAREIVYEYERVNVLADFEKFDMTDFHEKLLFICDFQPYWAILDFTLLTAVSA